jgi:hypothetical protein
MCGEPPVEVEPKARPPGVDQPRDVGDSERGIGQQHVRRGGDDGDRCEVAHRIVGQAAEHRGVDAVGVDGRHHQRVAVRRAARDGLGADVARGARPVVHDGVLAEALVEPVGDQARQDVGRPAGRERDHDPDDPLRIGGKSRPGDGQRRKQAQAQP